MRLAVLLLASSLVLEPGWVAPAAAIPPTPMEILASFRIEAGLRVELVAAEPDVESPVAMAFDERGRLWVVEMLDYPHGPEPGKPPASRIKILKERDGRFYCQSVFAEGLSFANGVMPWRDGAIVTAAPHVLWLRDTDDDGRADQKRVLFEGFTVANPQLRVSHPVLGIDNWIYVANGLRGGKVVRPGQPPETAIDLSGRDFRFDLIRGRNEPVSGLGQFANTFDDWGQRFTCDNRHHLRHVVLDDRYLLRNPFVAVPAVMQDTSEMELGEAGAGAKTYPINKNWTTSNLHAGRFTAACGTFVYRGGLLPSTLQGAVFVCDPTGSLVRCERLHPAGASFRSRPLREGVEFLASTNDWFRPVFLTSGPNGALYVVDMARAVIEHPEWMPVEQQNRPDLLLGRDRGRIWRIVPDAPGRKTWSQELQPAEVPGLIALLVSSNGWQRMTAHRLLLERQDRAAIPLLRRMVLHGSNPLAQLHAAWLIEGHGALDADAVLATLTARHPRLREQGLILAELLGNSRWSEAVRNAVLERADDVDERVRFQAALTIGTLSDEAATNALAKIAAKCGDSWTCKALAIAAPEHAGKLLARVLEKPPAEAALELVRELAEVVGARHDPLEVRNALAQVQRMGDRRLAFAALVALADGMMRRGFTFTAFVERTANAAEGSGKTLDALVDEAESLARGDDADLAAVLAATRFLGHLARERSEAVLQKLLREHTDPRVRQAAAGSLARFTDPGVAERMLESWPTYGPSLKGAILAALLDTPLGAGAVLGAVAKRWILPVDLDVSSTRRLTQHPDPRIRDRARQLLRHDPPEERKAVLERYQAALSIPGDVARGREVFRAHCASCHEVAGVGVRVGPDVSDNRTKTPSALLHDVLHPNAAIDANHVTYVARTRTGRVFTGLLASETAASVTLRRAENQTDVILRADLEELRSTGQSLMPEGLEKVINVEQMADLLAFLKRWRE